MSIETGGPAFPLQSIGPEFAPGYAGMSLRDYFAAKAMQGMMAGGSIRSGTTNAEVATVAYGLADAMLRARQEPQS